MVLALILWSVPAAGAMDEIAALGEVNSLVFTVVWRALRALGARATLEFEASQVESDLAERCCT